MPTAGSPAALHHLTDGETEGTCPVSPGEEIVSMEPEVSASESHALHLYGFLGFFCCLFLSSGQEFAFSFMSCQLLGAGCGHILPLTQGHELSVDPCSSAPGPFLTQAHLSRRLF